MSKLSPHELQALKDANPLDALVEARGITLGRINGNGVRDAACPCAPVRGKKPFWVNTKTNTYGCLKGGCGGDVFTWLKEFEGLNFSAALERLGGKGAVSDPEAVARAQAERAAKVQVQEEAATVRREEERAKAYEIFTRGLPIAGTGVAEYLGGRGLADIVPLCRHLRYLPDEPYYAEIDGRYQVIYRGPAMLAPIQNFDDRFMGAHLTWFDPANPGKKATIVAPDGTPCVAKKVKGLAKGGAIRLIDGKPGYSLLMGEGVETTGSVWLALLKYGRGGPYAAWSGVSINNISGGGLGPSTPHPSGRGWVPSSEPDIGAPGVLLPVWAQKLVLLGDGDSDPLVTTARMTCARRRYEAEGRDVALHFAPTGKDYNDLVVE